LLNTNNTFSGPIVVTFGTLSIGGSNTASVNGMTGGTVLIADNGSVTGAVNASGGILQFGRTAGFTFANNITGGLAVNVGGTGMVTLTGTNSYTSLTEILNGGTLTMNSFTGRLGAAATPVQIDAGGQLDLVGITAANVAGGF